MTASLWFRITAIVMLLFAVLHTIGFLSLRPPSAEGMAVWNGMNGVSFTIDGGSYSYGHFYRAFGLSITAAQLFGAWVAWTLGTMARRGDGGVRAIAWGLIAWQIIGIAIAAIYVSARPAAMSSLTVICLAVALMCLRKVQVAQDSLQQA
ncbi:MAG: hypothetical protein WAL75_20960 [Terracidiphilus sp.]